MRTIPAALVLLLAIGAVPAWAQQKTWFEGVWAKTNRECNDEDGPNSRTLIELRNKVGRLFDQYENHCKITDLQQRGQDATLRATCFEFWEDFEKGRDGRRVTISIRRTADQAISIDRARYQRCIR